MFRICLYLVTRIFLLIMIIGMVSIWGGFLVKIGLYMIIPDSFEMPLGSLSGIAVDSEGNIYCGSQFYSRVQVYDTEGKFLHGIFINTGGTFLIRINSNDQLEVAIERGDKLVKFDKDGELIFSSSEVPNFSAGFDKKSGYYFYDEQRDITYQKKPILLPSISLFGSHVIKKDSSGQESVIIKTPFLKWLFMGPHPAFFFGVFGAIGSFIANKKFRNIVLKCKDAMFQRAQLEQNNHKTKSGKIIKKRSIIVTLVSLGITGIAMMSMYILLYMNDIDLQQVMTISLLIITFVFLGIMKGLRLAWLMGRILSLISAIVLTIIALICLIFFGDRPYVLPTIILIAFQVIFLFVMYFSLDTVEARKHFNVLCPECGKSKIKASDLNFTKVICRKCGKEWS